MLKSTTVASIVFFSLKPTRTILRDLECGKKICRCRCKAREGVGDVCFRWRQMVEEEDRWVMYLLHLTTLALQIDNRLSNHRSYLSLKYNPQFCVLISWWGFGFWEILVLVLQIDAIIWFVFTFSGEFVWIYFDLLFGLYF